MEEYDRMFDVCIVCAMYEEAKVVLDEFSARCGVSFASDFSRMDRYAYQHTTIKNKRGESVTVLVTWSSDRGPVQTGLDLKPLLHEFRPRFLAMAGICAGDRTEVTLGDPVVAECAYLYEEGKVIEGSDGASTHLLETRTFYPTSQVLQYARGFDRWKKPVTRLKRQLLNRPLQASERPKQHIAPMASGMAVRSDEPFPWLRERFNRNTIALDMEAATFYRSLGAASHIHALVVKGVCDYADMVKDDTYHTYAARVSAVYLLTFIQEFVNEQTMPRCDVPLSEGRTVPSGVWNVPYRRNPHFTGRDELLDWLDQQLSSMEQDDSATTRRAALTQPQAIKGLGGIGKTQIAVEYAYRAREQGRYSHTFWVNAANEEALITSFTALAELLPAFPAKSETDQRKLVAAIKRWLEQCKQRWLLIFDNADAVSLIQEYLPQRGNGSILLTTRADAVGSLATSVEVGAMSFIEGTHLLLRRAQRFVHASDEEVNEAGNIVVALDHFPLALDQAGAYIEETKCRFDDYLQLYQNHRKVVLARRGTQATNYPDSVATTWSLSFQKVEQANPAAAELLRLCAFLAPDRIPEELITDGATHWSPLLQQATTNRFTFNQMIEELLKYSLVKRLVDDHMLSIHRLVQAVLLDTTEQDEQCQWAGRVVRAVNEVFPHDSGDVATWPQCHRYLEQAQACDTLIQQHLLVFIEAADVLNRTGNYLYKHASYTIAELLYQRALRIWEQQLGPEHPDVTYPLNGLAILYKEQGRYAEAELLYQRALHIREQALGPEHPDVAYTLNGLAVLYEEQGKHGKAGSLHQRALHIREQALGPEHPDVAVSLTNLAIVYKEQGKHEQVGSLYQRALHIREQALGPEHLDVAYTLNNLATFYTRQGKYAEAEPLYQRALNIREQALGPEHPELASPLNNLATFYLTQGKYAEAEPLYQRALSIWKQALGPEHPNLAFPLNNLGSLYQAQGKYAEAELLYQRALNIRKQALGPEHSLVASPLTNLAELYTLQGKYAEAEPLYQRALRIYEQMGPEHPNVATSLSGLANLYSEQGKYAEAELLYQRALSIREHVLEPHHPDTAETLHNFAALRETQGNQEEAASLYQRALTIHEQTYGPQHPKTTQTREHLRAVLAALGKVEEAVLQEPAETEDEVATNRETS